MHLNTQKNLVVAVIKLTRKFIHKPKWSSVLSSAEFTDGLLLKGVHDWPGLFLSKSAQQLALKSHFAISLQPCKPSAGQSHGGQETPGISSHISSVTLTSLNLSSFTSVLSLHKPFGKEISWLISVLTVPMSTSVIGMRGRFPGRFSAHPSKHGLE